MNLPDDSKLLDDPQFQSLLVSCMEALERGQEIDRDALLKSYPQYVEQLEKFLDDRVLLINAAATLRNVAPAPSSAFEKTIASGDAHDDFSDGDSIRYIGEYEIIEEIARGGMGVVFKARQQSLKRFVALKMILAGRLADEADVERFRREAQAAGRLKHPQIVAVHEVGEHEGRHYFTMDFVDGRSLSEVLREAPMSPRRAALVMRSVAEAVEYAHQQGTLHRDLKPANVLLTDDDMPHVTDFGLAKLLDSGDDHSRSELTASGQILGTPSHMSPEQAAGKQALVGVASDVYSLGSTLYACLTGRAPFAADSPVDTLLQVMHKEPVSPRLLNPAVPRDLETICLKCLQKEPHQRYGTAQLLADDLGLFLDGRPVLARPVSATSRAIRWAKRNRTIAALVTLSVLLLIGGTAVSAYFAIEANRRADEEERQRIRADHTVDLLRLANKETKLALNRETRALADMQTERDEAQRQRDRVEALLYATQLKAAQVDLKASRLKQSREHLDSCRADIRGWEHDYLSAVIASRENAESDESMAPNPAIHHLSLDLRHEAVIALTPDGRQAMVTGGYPNPKVPRKASLFNVPTERLTADLPGLDADVSTAAYRSDGRFIATGFHDGSVRIVDAETQEAVAVLPGHQRRVTTLVYSPDGRRMVSGSGEVRLPPVPDQTGEVILYDVDAGKIAHRLIGHRGVITCAAFSPDGRWIATGGFGGGMADPGEVRLWNAATGESVYSVDGPEIAVLSVAFSPDGKRLAVAGGLAVGEQDVLIVDAATGNVLQRLPDRRKMVMSVVFSPDGRRLATLGSDGPVPGLEHVKIWDASTGIELLQLEAGAIASKIFWDDDDRVRSIGRSNGQPAVVSWNAKQGAVLPKLIIRRGTASAASSIRFTSDGKQLISGGQFQTVRIWDADTGEEVQTLTTHSKPILSVAVDHANNRIASAGFDGVKVWDQKLGREILSIDSTGDDTNFYAVACSRDGQRFAGGASKGRVRVWAVTDNYRGELSTPTGHQGTVRDVAFSPNGERIVTAGSDATARVWNAETGEQISVFDGHRRVVTCVAYSPYKSRAASGSFDQTVRIWDVDRPNVSTTLDGHRSSVLCVAFSPNGKQVASGSADKTVKLWDAESGDVLATLTGHDFYVRSVAFSPDGSLIASSAGVEDMTIRIWPNPAW